MTRVLFSFVVLMASSTAWAKPKLVWPASCGERMKALKAELGKHDIGSDLSISSAKVELTVTFDPEIYYWTAKIYHGEHDEGTTKDDDWHAFHWTGAPDELRTQPLTQIRHAGQLEARVLAVYPDSGRLEADIKRDAPKRDLFWRSARAALDDCMRLP